MANNLDQIRLGVAAAEAIVGSAPEMAKLDAFATRLDELVDARGDRIFVPVFSGVEATTWNESTNNYAVADGNINGQPVVLDKHLKATVSASDLELTTTALKSLSEAAQAYGKAVALGVLGSVYAKVTAANYQASTTLTASAAETEAAWFGLYAAAVDAGLNPTECALTLNPAYYAKLLALQKWSTTGDGDGPRAGSIPSWVGFRSVHCATNLPTSENLVGFVSHRSSMAVASAPIKPASADVDYTVGTDPQTGVNIGVRSNYDKAKGRLYLTFETLAGSAVCRGDSLLRIVSA